MARPHIDLTGQRFGIGTAIRRNGTRLQAGSPRITYECLCDCGTTYTAVAHILASGMTKSCGCIRRQHARDVAKSRTLKFPHAQRLSRVLRAMKQRCYNPKHESYHNYGGRNITICSEWLGDTNNFYIFATGLGFNGKQTIDRIDVNGNYEPANCRFVDYDTQCNNKRNSIKYTFNGETLTATQWARRVGIGYKTLEHRLAHGWNIEEALSKKPVYVRKSA